MRIALVTEQFAPSDDPAARVTREVVSRLTDGGHDVVVFAGGRGQSTFRGARMFWASRMTPVSAVREAMALSRPDVCHLIDPHRLGIKAAEAAERLGVPTVVLDPRTWQPGRRPATTTTRACATRTSTTAGRACTPPTAASWSSATSARSDERKVAHPARDGRPAARRTPRGAR